MNRLTTYLKATSYALFGIGLIIVASVRVAAAESAITSLLDSNGDGIIGPYEAFDALLALETETGSALTEIAVSEAATRSQKAREDEVHDMLSEFDTNKDGTIELHEIDEEMLEFAQLFDTNGDGTITISEVAEMSFADALLSSEEEIQERLDDVFAEFDANKDGSIGLLDEVTQDERDNFSEWDNNRNLSVTREEAYNYMKADNTPVKFSVEGDTAFMSGVITSELPAAVLRLIFEHPDVSTIEMLIVPGSIDDVANLRAALYVNRFGISTKLNSHSAIASGGTDFFLAGKNRIVEQGATIGVHSWSGGAGIDGSEVPKDDPEHQKYIDFYAAVGIPESFYWYTMEAASPRDIHIMTNEEIQEYNVRTPTAP